ncbi:hypothetical protein PHYSODRAFT_533640 [Phytophthora sojae]|uniref:HAT C-terminal dimerisation domain-containing protein n=1 Tax=Phytophthora sojae (strain P6497) TaxID=1094619 RepID=G5AGF2_PHYSP|nr:hypothetical protein PHYSODRAFT_533640 [Phytophthora sojae]EGZ05392.1 hypothetical protein PHYSODRAFT_533640 [Phytophthora sojae]|eukprot:XP_009538923.1 hypothetical protein PHYSODRAFT_533640 [Phytophthora sojae]
MSIAFLLDPSTDIDDFVGADDEKVDDQVCEMARRCGLFTPTVGAPAFTAEVLAFKSKKRRGGKAMREKYSMSSPRDYWEGKKSERYPLLQKIAQIVFAIPTSSAASERAWSIFDHIHSKRRNRLSVAKVEMLAYVYINYGTIRSDSMDLARHQSRPESVDADS